MSRGKSPISNPFAATWFYVTQQEILFCLSCGWMQGKVLLHPVGFWVPEKFLCWSPLVPLPFSFHTHPCIHRTLAAVETGHHCCCKCSISKLLSRQPLMLCISFSHVILWYDLDFVLHRYPVLIQVLGTSLLFSNLFKSHRGILVVNKLFSGTAWDTGFLLWE